MKNTIKRDYGFDNLKLILICLVVLGHVLEIAQKTPLRVFCYQIIYSFHMPVFIFLFGYFARFDRERFLRHMLLPYAVFQLAYWALNWFLTGVFDLTFTTPYWIMWYLLAMMLYTLVIPVIDLKGKGKRALFFAVCFVLSLISGFDKNIGYFMSLARFFTFLPFFILGYYVGHGTQMPKFTQSIMFKAAVSLICVGCVVYLKMNTQITAQMMYGSFSYELAGFDVKVKLIIQIIGFIWTAFFIFVLRPLLSFKIPAVSELGKNTMPIFLLHGFLIKLCSKYEIFKVVPEALWSIGLLVLAIVLILGNPLVAKAYGFVFGGRAKKKAHTIT